jgi:hypothetical protein
MKRLLLAVLLLQALVTAAGAQSLADIARKEEERRKDIKKPAKVYTNKDLGPVGPAPPPAPAPAATTAAPAEGTGEDGTKPPTEEEQRAVQEQAWRSRMGDARSKLERSKMYAEALQTRANSLWADFTARDDPAQRAGIEAERKKTLAEIDKVKGEIQEQTKALADLEEEARRAGVPPGWLR